MGGTLGSDCAIRVTCGDITSATGDLYQEDRLVLLWLHLASGGKTLMCSVLTGQSCSLGFLSFSSEPLMVWGMVTGNVGRRHVSQGKGSSQLCSFAWVAITKYHRLVEDHSSSLSASGGPMYSLAFGNITPASASTFIWLSSLCVQICLFL